VRRFRGLLLSAYDALSHRRWHQSLVAGLPGWEWQILSLPPRHFSWRVRGNPLLWSVRERETLEADYDLLLATSMVDLATLRGLVPMLSRLPTVLYFHENQFVYPKGRGQHGQLEAQMVSIYSALAADTLLFNSAYNQSSFFEGVAGLLKRLPDKMPASLVAELQRKSQVLPVPVAVTAGEVMALEDSRLQIVWNHRWEYDKGAAELLSLVERLQTAEGAFCLHVVGQQFRDSPSEFAVLQGRLQARGEMGCWGYQEPERYAALLRGADVVLSTALHDFQGIAVIEAAALGCSPLVPDGLAYPEWFGAGFRYTSEADAVARLLEWGALKSSGTSLPRADVSAVSAPALLPRYAAVLDSQLGDNSVL